MAEIVGLVFSLVVLVILVLPILTFLRLGRLSADLETLVQRVERLEKRTPEATAGPAAPSPAAVAVSDAPDAPVGHSPSIDTTGPLAHPASAMAASPDSAPEPPDLESRIGGRGLLYLGAFVLLLGVSFFLKYAFDNAWIGETGQIVAGILFGAVLAVAGARTARRGLEAFGHALAGTGLAVVYLAVYAGHAFYGLFGPAAAFSALVLTTAAAAVQADRLRSQALAVIAVSGGFLTPFLVGDRTNTSLTLFTYDALLVVGTLILARRHHWLGLNAVSYVLTVVTLVSWAITDYTRAEWLRTLIWLTLFAVFYLLILRSIAGATGLRARAVRALLSTGPVAYHLAALAITAPNAPAVHLYLIAFTSVGLWLTAEPHRPWIRLLVLIGGVVPMLAPDTLPEGASWALPNVIAALVVGALHVTALVDRVARQRKPLALADVIGLHATGLALFSLLYDELRPFYPEARGGLAWGLAAASAGLARWLAVREPVGALNAAALSFTLVALGFAVQFDGPAVVVGWAAQGLAAIWLGLRMPSQAFQFGGLLLWSFATLRLLDGYFETLTTFRPILNVRSLTTAFLVSTAYAAALLFRRANVSSSVRAATALQLAASALTLAWITAEIGSFWELRRATPQAYLFEQVMLSLGWGVYGAALVAIGMRRQRPLSRYIGISVLALVSAKVFFYDLWQLGGIYRVVGFVVFGAVLLVVSRLYQRRRTVTDP